MAYNTKKGSQHSGDIQYEGDPNDTQIDFENDTVALKTGGINRVTVTDSTTAITNHISGASGFHVDGADINSMTATFGGGAGVGVTGSISGSSTLQAVGATTLGSTLNVSGATTFAGALSSSSTLQAVGAATFGSHLVTSGNVGVGVSTADTHIHANRATTTAAQGPAITLSREDATIAGADTLGRIYFAGTEDAGSNWLRGASITAKAGGAWAGGDLPTTLAISTCPDGSDTLTTALLIGTDQSLSASSTLSIVGSITSSANLAASGSLILGQDRYIGTPSLQELMKIGDGNIQVNGVLLSTQGISGSGPLAAVGATTLGSTLNVSGATTVAGAVSGSGALHIDGATTIGNTFAATGSIVAGTTVTAGSGLIGNTLDIGGSDLVVTAAGNLSGSGTLQAVGATTLGSTLTVSGALTGSQGKFDLSTGDVIFSGSIYGDGSGLTGIDSVSGSSRHYSTTGLETSGYLKVTGSSTLNGDVSMPEATSTLTVAGSTYLQGVTAVVLAAGVVSGSSTLQAVGATTLGSTLNVSGAATIGGNVSGSGTFTITSLSASGESHFSGNVGIGTATPLYDLHVNGAGVTVATIDGGAGSDAYLKLATAGTEKGYLKLGSGGNLILAQDATGGDLQLKAKPGGVSTTYLTLDGGTTTIVAGAPISAQAVNATAISSSTTLQAVGATILGSTLAVSGATTLVGAVSSSATLYNAGAATFSSTIAATGSVTAVGLYSTDLISGSLGMHVDAPVTFGGSVGASGSLSVIGKVSGSAGLHVDTPSTFGGSVAITGSLSGSNVVFAGNAVVGSTLKVTGSALFDGDLGIGGTPTLPFDVQSTSPAMGRLANTANDAFGALLRLQNTRATSNAGQANDFCGGVVFMAQDSTATGTQYGKITTKVGSPTNGAEAGYMLFEVSTAGTAATSYLNINGAGSAITASMPIHFQSASYFSGSIYRRNKNVQSSDYTLTLRDNIVFMDTNSNGLTASLPTIDSAGDGIEYTIKNIGTKTMVISSPGTTIEGSATGLTGSIGTTWTLFADNDIWLILSSYTPPA